MTRRAFTVLILLLYAALYGADVAPLPKNGEGKKRLAYLVSDLEIPFWRIMARGIEHKAASLGYGIRVYSAGNDARKELEALVRVLREGVAGIIVSPTNSSACVTLLKLAEEAGIPVVISDIGTEGGRYVSFISSDNRGGAYAIGRLLAKEMTDRGMADGGVGIIAIPQKRLNGRLRTGGFMQALNEAGVKGAGIKQQITFSYDETFRFATELIRENRNLKAIWLQGSDKYRAALAAIEKEGKEGEILLLTFDAEPEFLELIPDGVLAGAAMQQPFLMGEKAVEMMDGYLRGGKAASRVELPVLAVSAENLEELRPRILRNVFGILPERSGP